MIIFQIIFFVFTELFLVLLSKTKLDNISKKYSYAIAYLGFCLSLFFNAKLIMEIFDSGRFINLYNERLSNVLFIVSINVLIQLLLILTLKKLFIRILLPAVINLISCFYLFYFVGFGIINVVWSVIFTGFTCGILLLIYLFNELYLLSELATHSPDKKSKIKICKDIKSELDKYLKLGAQAFFAIAASIGVSMSILFKDGIVSWQNKDFLFTAVLMVFGMVFLSLGLLIWIGKPYLDLFVKISAIKQELFINNYPNKKVHITRASSRKHFRTRHL